MDSPPWKVCPITSHSYAIYCNTVTVSYCMTTRQAFQLPNNHTNHSNHDNANPNVNVCTSRSSVSSPNNSNIFANKSNQSNHSNNDSSNSSTSATQGFREAGIVEKLVSRVPNIPFPSHLIVYLYSLFPQLASYGFIQCCERQARLFFHYRYYSVI
jgi:hypothetical protein